MPELRRDGEGPVPQVREDRSIGELFGGLAQDMTLLVRQEVRLARAELGEKIGRASKDLAAVVTGGLFAWVGGLALVAAVILFLTQVAGLVAWLSALIVGAVLAAGGYAALRGALRNLRGMDPTPETTIRTLKDDIAWAKERRP